MFQKEVVLKSGRKIVLRELFADDNLEIANILGDVASNSQSMIIIQLSYCKVALSIQKYQVWTESSKNQAKKEFDEAMVYRSEIKNYADLKNFLRNFTEQELEELSMYILNMNSEDVPLNPDEVNDMVKNATEKK